MNSIKKPLKIVLIAIFLVSAYLAGFYSRENYVEKIAKSDVYLTKVYNKEQEKPKNLDFSVFWDSWKLLETKYVNRGSIDEEKLIYGAISGLVKSLDDPYSTFLDREQTKNFLEDISGAFQGIGIEIGIRDNILTVIAPIKGTPAEQIGLRAGDKIIKIYDVLSADLTLEEAVGKIRGPKGTEVVLTILRDNKSLEFKIIRDIIQVPVVEWQKIDNDIAWIKFYYFSENSSRKFRQTANEIILSQINKIILDLRNNPGGILDQAVEIASYFLPEGATVVLQDDGANKLTLKSRGYTQFQESKVVILINQGSASASEILAGALRDNKNIKLIGEKTFGKGTVQELLPLKGDAVIKLTVAHWLTPNGHLLNDQGLEPDIKIERKQDDIDKNLDPQLDKATEFLKNLN